MEPLSALGVASGVVAILQMTGTLISQGYSYIGALKDAPKDLKALVQELTSLNGILWALKGQLELAQSTQNNHQLAALELLNKPGGPFDSCKDILRHVEKRLKNLEDRKLGSYLVGPLKDKSTKQHIEQLERLKSVFQLALYTDQMTLSKAVEDYIREMLEEARVEQQTLGKHVRDTGDHVVELCRESKRRAIEGKAAEDYVRQTLDESVKEQAIIGGHVRDIDYNIVDLCRETQHQINKEQAIREEERRDRILGWISTIDHQSNHQSACILQQPGTGSWFIKGQCFREWQSTAGSVLWLHGIPGAGKTILSSTIIQDIVPHQNSPSGDVVVVYFYFDFKDHRKQKTVEMLGSLLAQLLQKLYKTPTEADTLFDKHKGGTRPTLHELLELLTVVLGYFSRCFLILDALDECDERHILLPVLGQLIDTATLQHISFLFTSRKEHDIETAFSKHPIINPVFIQNTEVAADVELYVMERMEQDAQFQRFSEDLKRDIKVALVEGARGMFRWVKCQLDAIRELNRPTAIREALKSLPRTLDDTYDRILLSIKLDDDKELVRRALQFIVFAIRPMTLEEVAEAVVIQEGTWSLEKEDRLFEPESLLSICPSLLNLTNGYLGLAHYSVQEYLKSERIRNGQASQFAIETTRANTEISKICLTYLGFNDFNSGPCLSRADFDDRLRSFPLLAYAARNWFRHVISESVERCIMELATRIWCLEAGPKYVSWRQIYALEAEPHYQHRDVWFNADTYRGLSTLFNPAIWGFFSITRYLLHAGANPNDYDSLYEGDVILQEAASSGYEKVVEILLLHGADVDISGSRGTALIAAAKGGHEKVVETLLRYGADINALSYSGDIALQTAASGGHEKVVEVLLQHGADINAEGGDYQTALQTAAYQGHDVVAEILLRHGADVNVEGGYHKTALLAAAVRGYEKVVKILLYYGADLSVLGGNDETALQVAASAGHEKVVRILLRHETNANTESGSYYWKILQGAASGRHGKVVEIMLQQGTVKKVPQKEDFREQQTMVEILLQHGAKINDCQTYLHAAAIGRRGWLVEVLLQHGADINSKDGNCWTALCLAADSGNREIVEILLQNGAEVNTVGGHYGTALQAAAYRGNREIVEILFHNGVDVNTVGGHYGTALQAAAYRDNREIVEILLQNGAEVNTVGGHYGTALQAAAYGGNREIVEILLQNGAEVNTVGGHYGTALQAAAYGGNREIVEILLQNRADANIAGGHYGTALQAAASRDHSLISKDLLWDEEDLDIVDNYYEIAPPAAAYAGNEEIVKILLQNGADVNIAGGRYGTALQAAAYRGNREIVEILLQNGADFDIVSGRYGTALPAAHFGSFTR